MRTEPIVITLGYLNENKTPNGGYNRKQVEALGLEWPLVSGWEDSLVGSVLSAENANKFEQATHKNKRQKEKLSPDLAINYLMKSVHKLSHQHIVRIREVEKKFFDQLNTKSKF